jgi:elongation factor P
MKIKAVQIRKGNILNYNNNLYRITESTHVTPGKGPAMMQVKMKRLSDGTKAEQRFRPDESVEKAAVFVREYQYLYEDSSNYYFMDLETYEQIHLTQDMLDDGVYYMLPETIVQIQFYDNTPIGVELPPSVELKVIETEPTLKGATVSSSYKSATLESGLVTQVPPFVEVGEIVRIDTRDGRYLDRAK